MTATSLAECLGVTKQAVSRYESGELSPAPEVMQKISGTLNLSIHFFLRPELEADPGLTFFRARIAASKVAKTKSERRYNWLREIVFLARRYVRFPVVKYPNFNPPSDPSLITNEMIRDFATATRRFWGLGDGPISNVVGLLENNGTIVARHELGSSELDAHSTWDHIEGIPFVILGNDKGSAARSRHDISHELGHLVIHRNIPISVFNQKSSHVLMEHQAHRFAGNFLMPECTFSEDFYAPTLDAFRAMKSKWKVSIASMLHRSVELGLIGEDEGTRLWIKLARRKWKTREPLDDVLQPEQPRVMERSLKLLSENQILTISDIAHEFGFAESDVETLSGLAPGSLTRNDHRLELFAFPSTANNYLSPTDAIGSDDADTIRFPGNRAATRDS